MGRQRTALLIGLMGVLASQAGHLVAYELRFGAAAQSMQSLGSHAYFPTVAKTGVGLLAATMLVGFFVVAVARMLAGARIQKDSAPAYIRLLAGLFTLQLALFAVQETSEAALSGAPTGSVVMLMLWGTAGQLPVAAVAALAVRWLLALVQPALALIVGGVEPAVQPLVFAIAPLGRPVSAAPAATLGHVAFTFTRRGPPS